MANQFSSRMGSCKRIGENNAKSSRRVVSSLFSVYLRDVNKTPNGLFVSLRCSSDAFQATSTLNPSASNM